MGIFEFILNQDSPEQNVGWEEFFQAYEGNLDLINVYKNASIDRITDMLSVMEFESYVNGERRYDRNQYIWNVAPNDAQSKSEFIKKLYTKLLTKGEVLVISEGYKYEIADTFIKDEEPFRGYVFKDVHVRGVKLNKVYSSKNVIYLSRDNNSMLDLDKHMTDFIDPLLSNIRDTYIRNRAKKYVLYMNAVNAQTRTAISDKDGDKEKDKQMPGYLVNLRKMIDSKVDSITTLPKGMELEAIEPESRYENDRSGIDNIIKLHELKKSLSILPFGVTNDVLNHEARVLPYFINSVLYPLAYLLEDAINKSSMYGEKEYINNSYMRINLDRLFYEESKDLMTNIEYKIRSGVYSINDARSELGLSEKPDEWASHHFMTKNNASIQDIMNGEDGKEKVTNEERADIGNEQ